MNLFRKIEVQIPIHPSPTKTHHQTLTNHRRRLYNDEPLPTKLSEHAPRPAKILGRIIASDGTFYELQIGEVKVSHVGIDEILDYVSPLDLENYEHQEFRDESELLAIAQSSHSDSDNTTVEAPARGRGRPRKVQIQQVQRTQEGDQSSDNEPVATGKHGRARPTYTHLFPLRDAAKESHTALDSQVAREDYKRPRRRRHPITRELMPLGWRYNHDAPEELARAESAPWPTLELVSRGADLGSKRMKLERSNVNRSMTDTLEDSSADEQSPQVTAIQRFKTDSTGLTSTSLPHITANNHAASPVRPRNSAHVGPSPRRKRDDGRNSMFSILQDSSESEAVKGTESGAQIENAPTEEEWVMDEILAHQLSDPRTHARGRPKNPVMLYLVKWESGQESWEPEESFSDRSIIEQYKQNVQQPSSTRHARAQAGSKSPWKMQNTPDAADSTHNIPNSPEVLPTLTATMPSPILLSSDSESEYFSSIDENGAREFEEIKAHCMSDPNSHPDGYRKEAVVLYQVKWKGLDELTWIPIENFQDRGPVNAYRARNNLS